MFAFLVPGTEPGLQETPKMREPTRPAGSRRLSAQVLPALGPLEPVQLGCLPATGEESFLPVIH